MQVVKIRCKRIILEFLQCFVGIHVHVHTPCCGIDK